MRTILFFENGGILKHIYCTQSKKVYLNNNKMLQSCSGKGDSSNRKDSHIANDTDQFNTCIIGNQNLSGADELIVKPIRSQISLRSATSAFGKFFRRGTISKCRTTIKHTNDKENETNENILELQGPENSIMLDSMIKRGRLWANRHKGRLVHKNGECNLTYTNVPEKSFRFILDIFTTLLDMRWTYTLLLCVFVLLSSFLIFAIDWFLIALSNGDIKRKFDNDEDLEAACVQYVNDFTSAFLFSIETQHTIGYGRRVINTKCRFAIVSLCFQSCFGLLVQSLFTGLIFAKLSRPRRRGETIMFSKNAVICFREGIYCLLFRVGDMRNQHFIAASVKCLLLRNKRSDNGENVPIKQETLTMISENSDDNTVFLGWPSTIIHKISRDSPLFNLNAEGILEESFELVVILGI